MACFDANPSALFLRDGEGLTPLQNLWNESRVDVIVHFMQDLCVSVVVRNDKKGKRDTDDDDDDDDDHHHRQRQRQRYA